MARQGRRRRRTDVVLEGADRILAWECREALTSWLRSRLDKERPGGLWFFTGTFRNAATTLNGAQHVWRRWWERLAESHLNSWAVYGIESQRRGTPHVHAIMSLPGCSLTYRGLKESWFRLRQGGIARAYPYDPSKGAAYYVSKYLMSDELLTWGIED